MKAERHSTFVIRYRHPHHKTTRGILARLPSPTCQRKPGEYGKGCTADAIGTSLQLAVLDEFSEFTSTISGRALTDNEVTLLLHTSLLSSSAVSVTKANEASRKSAPLHRRTQR